MSYSDQGNLLRISNLIKVGDRVLWDFSGTFWGFSGVFWDLLGSFGIFLGLCWDLLGPPHKEYNLITNQKLTIIYSF
jgi:hypothetical protein